MQRQDARLYRPKTSSPKQHITPDSLGVGQLPTALPTTSPRPITTSKRRRARITNHPTSLYTDLLTCTSNSAATAGNSTSAAASGGDLVNTAGTVEAVDGTVGTVGETATGTVGTVGGAAGDVGGAVVPEGGE